MYSVPRTASTCTNFSIDEGRIWHRAYGAHRSTSKEESLGTANCPSEVDERSLRQLRDIVQATFEIKGETHDFSRVFASCTLQAPLSKPNIDRSPSYSCGLLRPTLSKIDETDVDRFFSCTCPSSASLLGASRSLSPASVVNLAICFSCISTARCW